MKQAFRTGTQRAMILKALKAGKRLDWLTAFRLCGTSKCSTRIGEIEKAIGRKINRKTVTKNGKHFTQYWM